MLVDQALNVTLNNATNIGLNDTAVYDSDNNGYIDAYDDDDNDGLVNAYEDDDNDGTKNIHDDDDNSGYADYIEDDDNDDVPNYRDDDNDGTLNYLDDDNENNEPDYIEDDDGDGILNHLDDNNDDDSPTTPTPTPTTPTPTTPIITKTFSGDVMPILNSNCATCHGSNGNFTVTTATGTYTNIMALSGGTAYMISQGNGVNHGGGDRLNDTEYATIQSWIDAGGMNN